MRYFMTLFVALLALSCSPREKCLPNSPCQPLSPHPVEG